jgi:hypothetical protein
MVIKETILHSGWSYGNGDDQYDNESLGSTRTVFISEKLMENSSSSKKNGKIELIGSRNKDKHTEEYGWTKIGINSNSVKMDIGHPVSKSKFRTLVKVNLGRRTSR